MKKYKIYASFPFTAIGGSVQNEIKEFICLANTGEEAIDFIKKTIDREGDTSVNYNGNTYEIPLKSGVVTEAVLA
jgi:hypothetical protein